MKLNTEDNDTKIQSYLKRSLIDEVFLKMNFEFHIFAIEFKEGSAFL